MHLPLSLRQLAKPRINGQKQALWLCQKRHVICERGDQTCMHGLLHLIPWLGSHGDSYFESEEDIDREATLS
jgi:hypothetical protein